MAVDDSRSSPISISHPCRGEGNRDEGEGGRKAPKAPQASGQGALPYLVPPPTSRMRCSGHCQLSTGPVGCFVTTLVPKDGTYLIECSGRSEQLKPGPHHGPRVTGQHDAIPAASPR